MTLHFKHAVCTTQWVNRGMAEWKKNELLLDHILNIEITKAVAGTGFISNQTRGAKGAESDST